jgi:glycerol-3-phosphate acyltransferase PlsY
VILGHCYPALLGFKGGKGVACFIGAFLYIDPRAVAFTAVIFFLVVGLTKYISLGSVVGAIAFPVMVWQASHPGRAILGASIFGAGLIIFRHRANIVRLKSGTEHVFSIKGGGR